MTEKIVIEVLFWALRMARVLNIGLWTYYVATIFVTAQNVFFNENFPVFRPPHVTALQIHHSDFAIYHLAAAINFSNCIKFQMTSLI